MNNTIATDALIESLQQRINQQLKLFLPDINKTPSRLHEAMHYAVFNGGKRIRPLLVYATGLSLQIDLEKLDIPAVAIELIHCYSLVHDDLPAMDNDDYRRGKLSCHKAFDEATAILVGDGLQSLAFNVLTQKNDFLTSQQQINMVATLSHACGSLGMVGGQQLDLENKNKTLSQSEIKQIHELKTGVLFRASVHLGILAANIQDQLLINTLDEFGRLLGLAFQLQDDGFDQQISLTNENELNDLFEQINGLLSRLTIDSTPLHAILQYVENRIND